MNMNMTLLRTYLFTTIAGWVLTAGSLAGGSGSIAPDVSLRLADGSIARPADYKGKVLLLDFWASWCIPCRASFPALDAMYQRDQARGLEVLAVNVDESRKNADAFLAGRPHHMPIVFDPKGEAPQAFAISGMPSSILIDRTGHIRFTHVGYSMKIWDNYRKEVELLLEEHP